MSASWQGLIEGIAVLQKVPKPEPPNMFHQNINLFAMRRINLNFCIDPRKMTC
jgi:hypothetical protein